MKTIITAMVITVLGFFVHEFAHAAMANVFGYDVKLSVNSVSPINGPYESRGEAMLISIAGPVVTLLIGLLGAIVARASGSLIALWVVFTSLIQRSMAQAASLLGPNDEMRVSMELGIGAWTLPAAIVTLLLVLMIWSTQKAKPGLGRLLLAFLGTSIGVSIVVLGEDYLPSIIW